MSETKTVTDADLDDGAPLPTKGQLIAESDLILTREKLESAQAELAQEREALEQANHSLKAALRERDILRAERDSLRCQVVNGAEVEKRLKAELAQTNDALMHERGSRALVVAEHDKAQQKMADVEAEVQRMDEENAELAEKAKAALEKKKSG